MLFDPLTLLTTALAFAGAAVAAPHSTRRSFGVPSDDGFPAPNAQQLLDIERIADGKLSNAPPPAKLAPSSLTAFQVIAFNELFEVAYFKSMIDNITADVPGYQLPSQAKKDELLDIMQTILAQEKLHALNAIGTLKYFNAFAPEPCQYVFPTTNIRDAVALAETFTAVVLGTLQDASQLLAKNGDDGPVRAVASVIGQEGEQNGFFRILLARKPSEKPFLTTSVASYAWSALQGFVVPGSCPFPLSNVDLPIFKPLSVLSGNAGADVDARDQHLTFSADLTGVSAAAKYVGGNGSGLFVTYLTGQQLPISEPVQNVHWSGNQITFEAFFPYNDNIMDGLSIAALTTSGNFTGPDDLPAATIAAPGLIQVYSKVKAWDSSDI
ncbi:hypothetical protein CONLIGDRAFT_143995 [Coniochaeta ligniaria NRRL 30616]|uniref:Late sexual development protein n=1 Tax=Coniochaeta ligniaria NRRL 30616 TaxID=1408157 RepID=A0A1J7J173_9PEZI|nr:hypothetical protein CONLIGDRAFT_143995 [Coniochaeta ligniaria NRRL 30616]